MEVIEKEKIKRAQELANSVKTTKEAIRQAIADKDVDIPADTAFANYPSKIEDIYPDALFLRESNLGQLPVSSDGWSRCAYGNGKYIVVSSSGSCVLGTDLTGWQNARTPFNQADIAFGNGKFLCIRKGYTNAALSIDGSSWSQFTLPFNAKRIRFVNGIFFVIGDGNGEIARSIDGITWSKMSNSLYSNKGINDIAYGLGKYVLSCNYSDIILYSADLSSWKKGTINKQNSSRSYSFNSVTFNNDLFMTTVSNQCYFSSTDGITWDWNILDYDMMNTYGGTDYIVAGNGVFVLSGNGSRKTQGVVVVANPGDTGYIKMGYDSAAEYIPFFVNGKFIVLPYQYKTNSLRFSYDGIYWMESLQKYVQSANDEDVTPALLKSLKGISEDTLNAAYRAGVNAYIGE